MNKPNQEVSSEKHTIFEEGPKVSRRNFLIAATAGLGMAYAEVLHGGHASTKEPNLARNIVSSNSERQPDVLWQKSGYSVERRQNTGATYEYTIRKGKEVVFKTIGTEAAVQQSNDPNVVAHIPKHHHTMGLYDVLTIRTDGTIQTDVMQSALNRTDEDFVIRRITRAGDTTTTTPYREGKETNITITQQPERNGKGEVFRMYQSGTLLFERTIMPSQAFRRKIQHAPAVGAGRVNTVSFNDENGNEVTLNIRGKDGYKIYYDKYHSNARSLMENGKKVNTGEQYIAYDTGDIAYTFFHPEDSDRPDVVVMRDGRVKQLVYRDGAVVSWKDYERIRKVNH